MPFAELLTIAEFHSTTLNLCKGLNPARDVSQIYNESL